MKEPANQLLIAHEDYEILNNYIRPVVAFDRRNATLLLKEIEKARDTSKHECEAAVRRIRRLLRIGER